MPRIKEETPGTGRSCTTQGSQGGSWGSKTAPLVLEVTPTGHGTVTDDIILSLGAHCDCALNCLFGNDGWGAMLEDQQNWWFGPCDGLCSC